MHNLPSFLGLGRKYFVVRPEVSKIRIYSSLQESIELCGGIAVAIPELSSNRHVTRTINTIRRSLQNIIRNPSSAALALCYTLRSTTYILHSCCAKRSLLLEAARFCISSSYGNFAWRKYVGLFREIVRFLYHNLVDHHELYFNLLAFYQNDCDEVVVIDEPRWTRLLPSNITMHLVLRRDLFRGLWTYGSTLEYRDLQRHYNLFQYSSTLKRLCVDKHGKIGFYEALNIFDAIILGASPDNFPFYNNYSSICFDNQQQRSWYLGELENSSAKLRGSPIYSFDTVALTTPAKSPLFVVNALKHYPERDTELYTTYYQQCKHLFHALICLIETQEVHIGQFAIVLNPHATELISEMWTDFAASSGISCYSNIRCIRLDLVKLYISHPTTTFMDMPETAVKVCIDIYAIDTMSEWSRRTNKYYNDCANLDLLGT